MPMVEVSTVVKTRALLESLLVLVARGKANPELADCALKIQRALDELAGLAVIRKRVERANFNEGEDPIDADPLGELTRR